MSPATAVGFPRLDEKCGVPGCNLRATSALVTGTLRLPHCARHAVQARLRHASDTTATYPPAGPETRIGLVACCGAKRHTAQPAADLYRSALFTKSRAYVEATCERWFILSALHGLLAPEAVIEPYNVRLGTDAAGPIHAWAERTAAALEDALADVARPRLVVLAGAQYRTVLPQVRYEHEVPLAGLGIGEQLGWLTAWARSTAA